jgi:Alpha/beta hydrolase
VIPLNMQPAHVDPLGMTAGALKVWLSDDGDICAYDGACRVFISVGTIVAVLAHHGYQVTVTPPPPAPTADQAKAHAAELHRLQRELRRATLASQRATEARAALPPGSSRARVTTANARWMRAAEARDRIAAQIAALEVQP